MLGTTVRLYSGPARPDHEIPTGTPKPSCSVALYSTRGPAVGAGESVARRRAGARHWVSEAASRTQRLYVPSGQ